MNVSRKILGDRVVRALLYLVAVGTSIGFLVWGETTVTKVLGALTAIILGLLLKMVSELHVQLRQVDESVRAVSQAQTSLSSLIESTGSQLRVVEDRLRRQDATLLSAERRASETRTRIEARLQEVREEMGKVADNLTRRLEKAVAPESKARRHSVFGAGAMDELSLSDSLSGLDGNGEEPAE